MIDEPSPAHAVCQNDGLLCPFVPTSYLPTYCLPTYYLPTTYLLPTYLPMCFPPPPFVRPQRLTSPSQLQWGALRTLNVTVQEVTQVCADNEKQRFAMKPAAGGEGSTDTNNPAHWLIRANQGHSIKLESEALLRPVTLEADNVPPVVVHGTYFAFWPRIVESGGLRRMGRTHVHCSTGLPDDEQGVISGMRKDAEVLVYVDVRRSLEDGAMTWWISDNGVVLTEGVGEEGLVPAKYFKEVVGRKEDAGTLWKDGEWVADLPENLRSRPPPAKGGRGRGGGRGGKGGGRGRGKGV